MSSHHTDYLNQLHKLIVAHFDLNELRTLTFELGIDYETIPGTEKSGKARELVVSCARQSRLNDLFSHAQKTRPNINWPPTPPDFDVRQAIKDLSAYPDPKLEHSLSRSQNPFLVGSAVSSEFFVGRSSVIEAIKNRVGHPDQLQSLSLVANRRMGKTSLLKYVQNNYTTIFGSAHTYAVVYIDTSDADAYTNTDVMTLLRESVEEQTGIGLWKGKDDGKLPELSKGFKKLAKMRQVRLVLLLDEWEGVMTHPEVDLLLKALRSNGSQGHIGMITATQSGLFELCQQGKLTSNFYNIFIPCYLNNFTETEWESLVRSYYARNGREPHWRDVSLIGELAGGHPYLTQLAGSLVWQAEQQKRSEAQVRKAFYNTAEEVIFWNIWQHLNETQIQAIRNSLNILPFQAVPESVADELKDRGVFNSTGEVFCQPFAKYIKQMVN